MAKTRKAMYLSCAVVILIAVAFIAIFIMGISTASAESDPLSVDVKENGSVTTIHISNAKSNSIQTRSLSAEFSRLYTVIEDYDLEEYGYGLEAIMQTDDMYLQIEKFDAEELYDDYTEFDKFNLLTSASLYGYTDTGLPIYAIGGGIVWGQDEIFKPKNDQLIIRHDTGGTYYNGEQREGLVLSYGSPVNTRSLSPIYSSLYGVSYEFSREGDEEIFLVSGSHYIIAKEVTAVQVIYVDNNAWFGTSLGVEIGDSGVSISVPLGGRDEYKAEPLTINA